MTKEEILKIVLSHCNTSVPYVAQKGKLSIDSEDCFAYLSDCYENEILKYTPREMQDTLLRIMTESAFIEIEERLKTK